MDVKELQRRVGVAADGVCGPQTRAAIVNAITNIDAPAITPADIERAAIELDVSPAIIRAVRKVEAPRGAFDSRGRISILYERHYFSKATGGRFDQAHPDLSGPARGGGGYGTYSQQYDRLTAACALDPSAAFASCSWGAFQVMGAHADKLHYGAPFEMAMVLSVSERAHLDSFVRYVKAFGLVDALRQCRAGDAESCVAFVAGYNGPDHARFGYAPKLAEAAR